MHDRAAATPDQVITRTVELRHELSTQGTVTQQLDALQVPPGLWRRADCRTGKEIDRPVWTGVHGDRLQAHLTGLPADEREQAGYDQVLRDAAVAASRFGSEHR